jgi:hypothetical protein
MKREEYEEYESTFLRVNKHTEKKTDLWHPLYECSEFERTTQNTQ